MTRVDDVQDLLFPVEEHPIFVSMRTADGGRQVPVRDKKAIVNGTTHCVLGVVSRDYPVVTNEQALEWARLCCKTAFPSTSETEWHVAAADAPSTASYCHIDLVHNSGAVDFSLVRAKARPEVFGPFVRVTNSYNALRALVFDVGFHRKVCRNGLILPQSVIQFRFTHERSQLRSIRFDVNSGELTRLTRIFTESVSGLVECSIPEELFLQLVCGVLNIRGPVGDRSDPTEEAAEAWRVVCNAIADLARKYISELGANAYALLNTITDFASLPPKNVWVRRERHALQRRAGTWLSQFSSECKQLQFDPAEYLHRLASESAIA
jgi:hypothetical protein